MSRYQPEEAQRERAARVRLLLVLLLGGLLIIAGRLGYLNLNASEYRALGLANAVRSERLTPLRGRILARDGTVLAENRVATDLLYRGGGVARWPRLRYLLGLSGAPRPPDPENSAEVRDGAVLAWNLPDAVVPGVAELIAGQPGLYLRRRLERSYPTGLAAHAVGTTTEADPERFAGYELGDLVGQLGIEKAFQDELFGIPGRALLNVDSKRTAVKQTPVDAARPGQDVVLTLDVSAQRAAERVLAGALRYVNAERSRSNLPRARVLRGALVAMNPQTGEILALASAPTFDPNAFVRRPVAAAKVHALLSDRGTTPLTNRAVSAYPPASTFKVVSSLALLGGGYLTPETRLGCSPSFSFQGTTMRNWSPVDKGPYTVVQALADSCNTFFWRAAAATPGVTGGWSEFPKHLAETAADLGYGSPVGVGLPEEQAGRVPDEGWAERFYAHAWYPGYTMNMIIGQGDLLATPLQALQLVSTAALGGKQVQPHLVQRLGNVQTEVSVRDVPGAWGVVQAGMREMVTHYSGRGLLGPEFGVAVAGKTGTAQTTGADHAWFMGYGPVADPELAVVVFIENGGGSSAVAQPVARDFMRAYWSQTGRLAEREP